MSYVPRPFVEKICIVCDTVFSTNGNRKFCTTSCTRKHHNEKNKRQVPQRTVTCYGCQTEFLSNRKNAHWCSAGCRNGGRHIHKEFEKECKWCLKTFTCTAVNTLWCSLDCRTDAKNAQAKQTTRSQLGTRNCKICGNQFEPTTVANTICPNSICKGLSNKSSIKRFQKTDKHKKQVEGHSKTHGKKHRLMREFGLTIEQHDAMIVAQHNKCAICKRPPPGKTVLFVDHCHKTGKVRKLLCVKCNALLGFCNESLEYLNDVMDYIVDHEKIIYSE